MRQNIANFLYSNFLGRTSKKKHPVQNTLLGKIIYLTTFGLKMQPMAKKPTILTYF